MVIIEPQKGAEAEQELTIAEAARCSGLSAHALRYCERAGLLLGVAREGSSGHRRYSKGDLEWIGYRIGLYRGALDADSFWRYGFCTEQSVICTI